MISDLEIGSPALAGELIFHWKQLNDTRLTTQARMDAWYRIGDILLGAGLVSFHREDLLSDIFFLQGVNHYYVNIITKN